MGGKDNRRVRASGNGRNGRAGGMELPVLYVLSEIPKAVRWRPKKRLVPDVEESEKIFERHGREKGLRAKEKGGGGDIQFIFDTHKHRHTLIWLKLFP